MYFLSFAQQHAAMDETKLSFKIISAYTAKYFHMIRTSIHNIHTQ